LAKISGLRRSRPARPFSALKGKPLDVRAVARCSARQSFWKAPCGREGDRLRITAQLSSTDDGGCSVAALRPQKKLVDVLEIQDGDRCHDRENAARHDVCRSSEHVPRRYTENIQAYGLYLKAGTSGTNAPRRASPQPSATSSGRSRKTPATPSVRRASDSYSLDVDYRSIPVTRAYSGLRNRRKALALDESVPTAQRSSRGHCSFTIAVGGAEHEFRRAIELNRAMRARISGFSFLLAARGQHDAALLEGHTALELDFYSRLRVRPARRRMAVLLRAPLRSGP